MKINEAAISNYEATLNDFNGDKQATRMCLSYMNWLLQDIEVFKGIDLTEYKDIWQVAYNELS